MHSDPENFEQLRRLFALKRHEQPPPGYFEGFSRDVISRIKAGERGETATSANWLHRFWALLEAKPVFAGAFGAGVCAVLISGILNADDAATVPGNGFNSLVGQSDAPFHVAPAMALNQTPHVGPAISNNPAASLNSLFDFHLSAQPASYSLGGN